MEEKRKKLLNQGKKGEKKKQKKVQGKTEFNVKVN